MNLMFSAGAIVGDELFFSSFFMNGLFSLDLKSEKLRLVAPFPSVNVHVEELHKKAIYYNGKIYFLPDPDSRVVHIYDCDTAEIISITISVDSNSKYWCSDGFIVKNKLWILPGNREERIVTIDLTTLKEKRLVSFSKYIEGMGGEQTFLNNAYLDGKFYMPLVMSKKIVVYDIASGNVDVLDTGYEGVVSAYSIKGHIMIATRKSELLTYDKGVFNKQIIMNMVNKNEFGEYHICAGKGNRIYLLPIFGGKVFVGDINNNEFKKIVFSDRAGRNTEGNDLTVMNCGNFSTFYEKTGECLAMTANGLLLFNDKGFRKINIRYKNPHGWSMVYKEGDNSNLEDFIEDIIFS